MSEDIKNEAVEEKTEEVKPEEIKKDFTAEDLLNDIGSEADITPVVLLNRQFYIKRLSVGELLNVHGRSVRKSEVDGSIIRDVEVESRNKILYGIAKAVVKGEHDTTPLFDIKQVNQLIDNPKANDLLDSLVASVIAINPDLKNV
jgi:hypothetical protein